MKDAPRLLSLLLDAATTLGCQSRKRAGRMDRSAVLNSEVLRSATSTAPFERDARDLPTHVGAAQLDDTPVLVGELPQHLSRGAVEEALRRYRNQATVARSWMGLAGPQPSDVPLRRPDERACKTRSGDRPPLRLRRTTEFAGNWSGFSTPRAPRTPCSSCKGLLWRDRGTETSATEELDPDGGQPLPPGWMKAVDNADLG